MIENDNDLYRIRIIDIWFFFVLLSFLHPKGFSEISPIYNSFFTSCVWLSTITIFFQLLFRILVGKLHIKKIFSPIVIYFIAAYIITYVQRDLIESGLQQLIATPALCLFLSLNFERNWKSIIHIINNLLIIFFIINLLTLWNVFSGTFHQIFLGHVQVVPQFGLLAFFFANLEIILEDKKKIKDIVLILLAIVTMLFGDVLLAIITLVIMLLIWIVYKWRIYQMFSLSSMWYIIVMFFINMLLLNIVSSYNNILQRVITDYTLSGRMFIWRNAIEIIKQQPWLGYGIAGVQIQTFWSMGMNYAHNQIIQNLIDGGVVLLFSFWMMILSYGKFITKLQDVRVKVLSNATLIAFLSIMLTEAVTIYVYFYLFLSILLALYKIVEKKRGVNYEYIYNSKN